MAHLYKKVKKGREYYYIRENQRVKGKSTTVNQVYLGTADKVETLLGRGGFLPRSSGRSLSSMSWTRTWIWRE